MHEGSPDVRCPLCSWLQTKPFFTQTTGINWQLYNPSAEPRLGLRFYRCDACGLISKDPAVWPTMDQERARYENHENDPDTEGYAQHLAILLDCVLAECAAGDKGLDFGCGPTKAMEALVNNKGFECASFDPLFHPNQSVVSAKYDFITCVEVAEHLHKPLEVFRSLAAILAPGGTLGIMTQWTPRDFANWWYHRDPTHVVFYNEEVLKWIAERLQLCVNFPRANVALLKEG